MPTWAKIGIKKKSHHAEKKPVFDLTTRANGIKFFPDMSNCNKNKIESANAAWRVWANSMQTLRQIHRECAAKLEAMREADLAQLNRKVVK